MYETLDFSTLQIISLTGLVFLAGFVDSIAGGGGLISLPAYFAFGLPPHTALATNKFSSSLGTVTAVVRYARAGRVQLVLGLLAAGGALIGASLGAKLALLTPPEIVRQVLLVLVPIVAAAFWFRDRWLRGPGLRLSRRGQWLAAFGIGWLIGGYDGFFGPGTGAFMAIAFYLLLRFDLVTAAANARLANLASNLGSLTIFLLNGKVLFPLAIYAACGGIAGNLLGSRLVLRNGERIIRPLTIAVLVLLLAAVAREQFMG